MFKKLLRKKIEKRIDRALKKRDRSRVNDSVKTVAILFDGNFVRDLSFFDLLLSCLKISENKCSYLGFVTVDKKQPSLPKHLCSKKDFSWSGEVKSPEVKNFVKQEFDMLILYHNSNQYLNAIAAKSKAHFKVGCTGGDERLLDLILAVKPTNKNSFNTEILKYLKILGKL